MTNENRSQNAEVSRMVVSSFGLRHFPLLPLGASAVAALRRAMAEKIGNHTRL